MMVGGRRGQRISLCVLAVAFAAANAFVGPPAVNDFGRLRLWPQIAHRRCHAIASRRLQSSTAGDADDSTQEAGRLASRWRPDPNGRPPEDEDILQDESVNMIVKMSGDPEKIMRGLREAGLIESAVVDTIILHSDKARWQRGTNTLKGRKRIKDRSYFGTPLWQLILRRSSVLVALMFLQSLSSLVLQQYEALIQDNVVLALFLTMLVGAGGNAGNQSLSIIIRGMSTGEIADSTVFKAIGRELLAGFSIGAILGVAAYARVLSTSGTDPNCAFVIALSTFITVVLAITGGTLLPIAIEKMGNDPVVTSSPILATLTDIGGVLVLCSLASKILYEVFPAAA